MAKPDELNRIRVETALSRFPIHRLAKKGTVSIQIRASQTALKWEVSYNAKHGQPGPLAYKIDTLVINRRIDDAPKPLPKLIRLGSLHDIAVQVGLGGDTNLVKKGLHQNAAAYVEFSIRYKSRDGEEKTLEQGDTRYGVIFTGEKLPDGQKADCVYLVLHDWYRQLLDDVTCRPLDYDYLKKLAPGAQRFYELLSFQIFGALASGTARRAKLLYSNYCTHAPQQRYGDWEHVRKQMYKLHAPHLASGYIQKVEYRPLENDWEMLYTPGPKAWDEYRTFTSKRRGIPEPEPLAIADSPVIAELTRRGVTEKKARQLLTNAREGQDVVAQIEYVDSVVASARPGKFHNPSGFYVRFIEDDGPIPLGFVTSAKLRQMQSEQQASSEVSMRESQLRMEYNEYLEQEIERLIAAVSPSEYEGMVDTAFKEMRAKYKTMTQQQLREVALGAVRAQFRNRVPAFTAWRGA